MEFRIIRFARHWGTIEVLVQVLPSVDIIGVTAIPVTGCPVHLSVQDLEQDTALRAYAVALAAV